jgi:hypothetical protein
VTATVPTAEVVVAPAPVAVVEQPAPVVVEQPAAEVYVQPDLVEVSGSPGVQVIADYNEPIFFTGGLYWHNDGGVWYSSTVHTGGWARAEPPEHIRVINRTEYAHYRPAGYVPREQRPGYRAPAHVEQHPTAGHPYEPAHTQPAATHPYEPAHTQPVNNQPKTYEPTHVEPTHTAPNPTYTPTKEPTNSYKPGGAGQPVHPTNTVTTPAHTAPPAQTYKAPPPAAKPAAPSAAHPAPKYTPPKKK